MFVFTSCTTNYIPKARILASSLKTFHPDWTFCLLLGEAAPEDFNLAAEPFDRVEFFDQLGIADYPSWLFRHRVVEICTAAKGPALYHFLVEERYEKVLYLDPDIMVCNSLAPLEALLDDHDILLTPHQLAPQPTAKSVRDNEIVALQYGVFNLGFLGVARRGQGLDFARWWRDRLLEYCYDDIPRGLFTDQRWCDLVPAFFSRLHVVRDPGCNAASWNLTDRVITRNAEGVFMANGGPLRLYHFTGYDSGAGRHMTALYAVGMPAVFELWNEYGRRLKNFGHQTLGKRPWAHMFFDDGTPIADEMRLLYRRRADVRAAFPDPFATPGYLAWYRSDQGRKPSGRLKNTIRHRLRVLRGAMADNGGWLRLARTLIRKCLPGGRGAAHAGGGHAIPPSLESMLASTRGKAALLRALGPQARSVLLIEHDWGGGAALYLEERAAALERDGHTLLRLKYSLAGRRLELEITRPGARLRCRPDQLLSLSDPVFSSLSAIVLNEVASWYLDDSSGVCGPDTMRHVLHAVRDIAVLARARHVPLELLFHDFYMVCPRVNFLRPDGSLCAFLKTGGGRCDACLGHDGGEPWRAAWQSLLAQAGRLVFFSESSRRIVERFYSLRADQVHVCPHAVSEAFARPIRISSDGPMRIAVVGHIAQHKGRDMVARMAALLERRRPEARIVVFGRLDLADPPGNIRVLGDYARETLPAWLERERITAAAFTSVWPETFSYVAHELAAMGIPLAAFQLGAQGELVASLRDKGRLVPDLTPEAMLDALLELDALRTGAIEARTRRPAVDRPLHPSTLNQGG